jgi:hypothetical protein
MPATAPTTRTASPANNENDRAETGGPQQRQA